MKSGIRISDPNLYIHRFIEVPLIVVVVHLLVAKAVFGIAILVARVSNSVETSFNVRRYLYETVYVQLVGCAYVDDNVHFRKMYFRGSTSFQVYDFESFFSYPY